MKTANPKGGRPRKVGEKRDTAMLLRLTPTEKAQIEERAARAGLDTSDYVRSLALGFKPSSPSVQSADPAVISLLNAIVLQTKRVGNNVNQLSRAEHRGSAFREFWTEIGEELQSQIADTREALAKALAR